MNRIKTLSFPLISALVATCTLPASAQISLTLGSNVSYRQSQEGMKFQGGNFAIELLDGTVITNSPCNSAAYYPPGFYIDCPAGTSGYLLQGTVDGGSIQRPYLLIETLRQAEFIEPFQPDYVALTAAPASTLKRPQAGFRDDSALLSYNLNSTTGTIQDYKFSNYFLGKNYTKSEQARFQSEVVPGVYQFTFPGIIPTGTEFTYRPLPVSAVVNPMVDGFAKVNNTDRGVKFVSVNGSLNWHQGYVELSYFKPNLVKWVGFTPDIVFSTIDSLYISMKALADEGNPNTSTLIETESLFPAFDNGRDTRILIPNPYINSYTFPPVFPSGQRGMVELELIRNARTGGISYDKSTRQFQFPVIVLNRYTEYAGFSLDGIPQKDILADPDKDGYNNLNEWILGSGASDRNSIPAAPIPAPFQAEDDNGAPIAFGSYFGFNVTVQTQTIPKVTYILQRSKDLGKTWTKFVSNDKWDVDKVTTLVRNAPVTQIQVRSRQLVDPVTVTTRNFYEQPDGTVGHIYRVKIVLKK